MPLNYYKKATSVKLQSWSHYRVEWSKLFDLSSMLEGLWLYIHHTRSLDESYDVVVSFNLEEGGGGGVWEWD